MQRAAWELQHESGAEYASLAFIVRKGDGTSFVGRPREHTILPAETLLGLLVEESGDLVSCRVRDHALDPVRFIDARFRTSIVVRVVLPSLLLPEGDAALWFGLQGGATPKKIELAQAIANTVTSWFEVHAPILRSIQGLVQTTGGLRAQLADMTMVAHDARAPIGALQYLIADVATIHPELACETENLQEELRYVNRLLARFSPGSREDEGEANHRCDVSSIVRRVCTRFSPEAHERGNNFISLVPVEALYGCISDLDCERIVSNIVGNAVRYSQRGEIKVELCQDGKQAIVVRVFDSGPGIPQAVLDRIAHGDLLASSGSTSKEGWGVGLISCNNRLKALGGALRISSSVEGSCVEIVLPSPTIQSSCFVDLKRAVPPASQSASDIISDSAPTLILVDDDMEHSESLERLLGRSGIKVKIFESISEALEGLELELPIKIICDANMPDGGAEKLLQLLSRNKSKASLAVISGESSDELVYRYAALGARAFFAKPIEIPQLLEWAKQ